MNTQSVIKYTPEVSDRISKVYTENPTLETVHMLAEELGVSERSLIAKLSALGVYKKKQYLNKRGERPIKKEEYIQRIASMLTIDPLLLECMEKCTKQALVELDARIRDLIYEDDDMPPERIK